MPRSQTSRQSSAASSRQRLLIKLGVAMIVLGGIVLMFGGDQTGTLAGTVLGLAGVGIAMWAAIAGASNGGKS